MAEHPNALRVREGYDAFAKGDLATLEGIFCEDIVWHIGGTSQLAGDYHGRTAVYGMLGRLMELTEGSFTVDVRAAFADDHDGVALVLNSLRRGERAAEIIGADIYRFVDGTIVEAWFATTDAPAFDAIVG